MNSKELMKAVFRGEGTERVPVAPHWWGTYKFQTAGLAASFEEADQLATETKGDCLVEVNGRFYEEFHPDWFHLGTPYLSVLFDDHRQREINRVLQAVRRLESKQVIDEYLALIRPSEEQIRASGLYDHVRPLVQKYGDRVMIAVNEGNPVCDVLDPHGLIGFIEGLVALTEKPGLMGRLIYGLYEGRLQYMKVLASYGCHAYVGSETYVAADLIAPAMYRDMVFPAHQRFYREVRKLGMEPIIYFLGDIVPLIEYINQLDVTALMVEESKKSFILDVVEIRKKLAEHITLFGNLDSVEILLRGSAQQVKEETRRQLQAAQYGQFVMANGSPIAFDTPRANLRAMIDAAQYPRQDSNL